MREKQYTSDDLLIWLLNEATTEAPPGLIELVLSMGAKYDYANQYGQTPMHFAAQSGNDEVVLILFNMGADVNAVDGVGNTPLHYAAENFAHIVRQLHGLGAEVNARNKAGKTPLAVAEKCGATSAIQALKERGGHK